MARRFLLVLVIAVLVSGCTLLDKLTGRQSPEDVIGGKATKLLVEIDHPSGSAPNAAALAVLKSTLGDVTAKTVEVRLDPVVPSEPDKKYSDAELRALENQHRNSRSGGDTTVLYILYVAGGHVEDNNKGSILGQASAGGSMVLFKANIRTGTSGGVLGIGATKEEFIERAVLVHEFGHVAGLVNFGAPMVRPHEDAANPGHSSNEASVMFWKVESTNGIADIITGGASIPYQFDADDKADLNALREA